LTETYDNLLTKKKNKQSIDMFASYTVATRQTRRDGVEGEGLRVLESRRSRMTCGTWRRSTVDVHKMIKGSKVGTS
jgi:hypothetical protein